AREGAAVGVNVRSQADEGKAGVQEIVAAGGEGLASLAGVGGREGGGTMVAQGRPRLGRLGVVVNNPPAREESAFDTMEYESWRHALAVCLDGAFHCTQAALPLLKRSDQAAVVNIGGLTAHTGASKRVHVVTAKAGLVGMTRALATELS